MLFERDSSVSGDSGHEVEIGRQEQCKSFYERHGYIIVDTLPCSPGSDLTGQAPGSSNAYGKVSLGWTIKNRNQGP